MSLFRLSTGAIFCCFLSYFAKYSGNEDDVHHLFFSRLWTVGRTLDDIIKTRRRYLRLKAGEEEQPLELAPAGSPHGFPLGERPARLNFSVQRAMSFVRNRLLWVDQLS